MNRYYKDLDNKDLRSYIVRPLKEIFDNYETDN